MKVKLQDIGSLTPYARNPRKNAAAVAKVKASIAEFGWQQPIVVDDEGIIVAGHTRYLAAQELGLGRVPVKVASGLTEAQIKAYRLMDNRSSEDAEWDDELLAVEFEDLASMGFDMAMTGFSDSEILGISNPSGSDSESVPAPPEPEDTITNVGDVWTLGSHTVVCGDSTDRGVVELATGGAAVDLLATDPPYGVSLGQDTDEGSRNRRRDAKIVKSDELTDDALESFLAGAFRVAFDAMKPGATFYIFHASNTTHEFLRALRECGERERQILVWEKDRFVMCRQDYHWQHEPCLYGWKKGAAHGWYSDRKQTTVLRFDRPQASAEHPTMKPVALVKYLIANSTAPQGRVLDPFLGSGTTLIACEELGRSCVGVELDPSYCDVIVNRWERATGRSATRESS